MCLGQEVLLFVFLGGPLGHFLFFLFLLCKGEWEKRGLRNVALWERDGPGRVLKGVA